MTPVLLWPAIAGSVDKTKRESALRDELNEPLGLEPPPPSPFAKLGGFVARAVAVVVLVAIGGGAAVLWRSHTTPKPAEVAQTSPTPSRTEKTAATSPAASPSPTESHAASGGDVEMSNGVKIVRNGGGPPSLGLVIDVPTALGLHLPPAPDPRLAEKSRFGLLPRIGTDGSKPVDVYARPEIAAIKLKNAPRIALLVGGLGLDAPGTDAAISRLPAAVSLGFAPYGQDLPAQVSHAREAGHEVLLQAPMEPFSSAQQPGPHMLLTSASEAENREALQWMMGRFTGFIGVENYLGGKFSAENAAFAAVLAELSSRGLGYLDDGSSPRSLTAALAPGLNMRSAIADVVIDANPTPEAIEAALTRLEGLARRQDGAIGVATALPASIDHIARWTAALEARGIALTPISALLGRQPP